MFRTNYALCWRTREVVTLKPVGDLCRAVTFLLSALCEASNPVLFCGKQNVLPIFRNHREEFPTYGRTVRVLKLLSSVRSTFWGFDAVKSGEKKSTCVSEEHVASIFRIEEWIMKGKLPASRWFLVRLIVRPWRSRRHVTSKRLLTSNGIYSIISYRQNSFRGVVYRP
jgi:hypothetical protein